MTTPIPRLTGPRARLFEQLHQQQIGALVAHRLSEEGTAHKPAHSAGGSSARIRGQFQAHHLQVALASWGRPPLAKPQADAAALAPKPRRNHEFFRAVRP